MLCGSSCRRQHFPKILYHEPFISHDTHVTSPETDYRGTGVGGLPGGAVCTRKGGAPVHEGPCGRVMADVRVSTPCSFTYPLALTAVTMGSCGSDILKRNSQLEETAKAQKNLVKFPQFLSSHLLQRK